MKVIAVGVTLGVLSGSLLLLSVALYRTRKKLAEHMMDHANGMMVQQPDEVLYEVSYFKVGEGLNN